ncbi:GatB/YqeY domain-containing protein [Desulfonatronovibrio magnus]|uniref:GatB/YqeY domain-containing protein n=1 Tax=Desulfonatronovibrio magnus TaxID=698827 RepID=UPI0005EB2ADF|nr:GatB/YqeY domain-containing protein [Desulfonatronovibrio magnus]RQD68107.1 MAG: GatB/YqeY domain-containing protein [Desulfonatronovibrio sp. MSAO_Bac4]
MLLAEKIEKDFITAYKSRQSDKVAVLRMLKTAIKNKHVELKRELTDAETAEVLIKQVKQRQESIRQYTQAGRDDLSLKEQSELDIINTYLPSALTPDEMRKVATETIQELGVKDMKGMGTVMKAITQKYPGQTDGRELSAIVKELLSS